nr:Cytochrome c oxidase assembly protein COX11 [Hymenolepis microstoma]
MPPWLRLSPLCWQFVRPLSQARRGVTKTTLYYASAMGIFMLGLGYAGVPLYRIYCAKTGSGTKAEGARFEVSDFISLMKPVRERRVTVEFSADTYSHMAWNFKPSQRSLVIVPGETALAFYTAKNPTSKPIIGIATYTVLPLEAAKYFNKIQVQNGFLDNIEDPNFICRGSFVGLYRKLLSQFIEICKLCFCFEEQRLNPGEEVDLPVFFFLDPEFDDDPDLMRTNRITLHYTFFEAKKERLMVPGISKPLIEDVG